MPVRIKINSSPKVNVKTQISTPESLSGVDNVNIDNIQDGYILAYDDNLKRYSFVDPDNILSKAVEDDSLPQEFIDKLDQDLDNKINLDGGTF